MQTTPLSYLCKRGADSTVLRILYETAPSWRTILQIRKRKR